MHVAATALVAAAALTLSACGGDSDPLSSGGEGGSGGDPNTIVVGSANFTESEIIANIYADALKANGFDASTRLSIGSREAYIPAVRDGSIDLIPDYTGNLLLYLDPDATATAPDEVNTALTAALSEDLLASTPATLMEMGGRSMAGWLRVASEHVEADDALNEWVGRGVAYARSLPPK